jgi:ligand-binding SRPBCC domain-containing protein
MPTFRHSFVVRACQARVSAFHFSENAFSKLTPPGIGLQFIENQPLAEGSVVAFRLWLAYLFPIEWIAVHSQVTANGFVDVQTSGPMKTWRHQHSFIAISEQQTQVVDEIQYEHHLGWRKWWTRVLFGRLGLYALFFYRAMATHNACRSGR